MTQEQEIWHVIDSSNYGGIESHIDIVSNSLKEIDHTTRVVFLEDHGEHPLKEKLADSDIPVMTLERPFMGLKQAIKQHEPHVVHTHGYKAGILGKLACKFASTRCISTYHSGDFGSGKVRAYNWLDHQLGRLADHNLAVSSDIKRHIKGKSEIVPNAVPLVEENLYAPKHTIGFVGRLSEEKGVSDLATVASSMTERNFVVFGDGDLASELEGLKNVKMRGYVDDMEEEWQDLGALVIPSKAEGLPMAALEAMAHGVPAIAYAVGGLTDLIKHGHNGLLVEPQNAEALEATLDQFIRMPAKEKREMSKNAFETIANGYSTESLISTLLEVYKV